MCCSRIGNQNKYNKQGQSDTNSQAALQGQGKENKAGTQCVAFRRSMKPVIDIRQPKQTKSTNKEEKKPPYQEDNRKDIEDRSEPAYN